ncbi:hypothetical protein E3N88_07595 [Mikania micrantha]|uniref:Integrase catalytic domain-containing protein n=1 Tax=Mikania micrantha TaxID=192012 RepID=A0A5N6PUW2_9ASTR|nr:hypothetical protein E3N88_07595 [Mikania micrantha]
MIVITTSKASGQQEPSEIARWWWFFELPSVSPGEGVWLLSLRARQLNEVLNFPSAHFITKLPRTAKQHDSIWVIVDRLTKSAHFLPIRETYSSEKLSKLFVKEIVARHGVPLSIVSDRDTRFTSRFWKIFHEQMGMRLCLSTAYHPQTDGQTERTIQTLEDMLRACVIDFGGNWDDHLPLVEFSYNNSYHASIGMPPYEMLYGRRCRTPLCWGEVGQKDMGSKPDVELMANKLAQVRARLKASQDRLKSYADKRRRPIEFNVGDRVLLKVSPWKGLIRFRKRGKLSPRYIGWFKILARIGKVAYRLELPDELSSIHPTFHVSHLRKCLVDETSHVLYDEIEIDDKLNYVEEPVVILDRDEKRLRNKTIKMVKVQWKHRKGSEATWETEEEMRTCYPQLFTFASTNLLTSYPHLPPPHEGINLQLDFYLSSSPEPLTATGHPPQRHRSATRSGSLDFQLQSRSAVPRLPAAEITLLMKVSVDYGF